MPQLDPKDYYLFYYSKDDDCFNDIPYRVKRLKHPSKSHVWQGLKYFASKDPNITSYGYERITEKAYIKLKEEIGSAWKVG